MALVPRMLRPSVVVRRKAVRQGFLGPSSLWKAIGVLVFAKGALKKFFGRNPEVIDVSSLGPGRSVTIATAKPMTRRARRKLASSGTPPPSLAEQRAEARRWADRHARAKSSR